MLRNQAGEAFIRALTMVVGGGDGAKWIQPVNCRQLPRTRSQSGGSKDSARASEQVHRRTTQVVTKSYAGIYVYYEGKSRKNNNKRNRNVWMEKKRGKNKTRSSELWRTYAFHGGLQYCGLTGQHGQGLAEEDTAIFEEHCAAHFCMGTIQL